jgi:hypothetical protein
MTWSSSPVGPSSTSQGSGGGGGWCRLLRRRLAGVRPLLPQTPHGILKTGMQFSIAIAYLQT